MVSASEIKDEASLRAWLEERPRKDAVAIAARAALRVAPVYWALVADPRQKAGLVELPVSRAVLLSAYAVVRPNADIKVAAAYAYADAAAARTAAYAAGTAAYTTTAALNAVHATTAALNAVLVAGSAAVRGAPLAARAAAIALAPAAARAAALGAHAVARAADHAVIEVPRAFWGALSVDAAEIEAGRDPFARPLWPEGPPDGIAMVHRDWRSRGGAWEFWADWYEGYLTGNPLDFDLLQKVAEIEPEDWDKGDDHVSGMIADIYDEWESPTTEIDRPPLNLALIARQASVLRDYIVGELERARGRNSDSDADLPRLELLKELLQEALAAVDGILEHLASSSDDQSTALVVVEQKLPIIVDAAERLATEAKAPRVSEPMLAIAATMKVLTEAGMDPKDAARLASGDVLGPRLIAWFRSWLPKRK